LIFEEERGYFGYDLNHFILSILTPIFWASFSWFSNNFFGIFFFTSDNFPKKKDHLEISEILEIRLCFLNPSKMTFKDINKIQKIIFSPKSLGENF